MPSSSSRSRSVTRRSPRAAPRPAQARYAPAPPRRPQLVPIAVAFGVLTAAEDIYLAYLLWEPDRGWYWYVLLPLLLAGWAVAGAGMVWQGRPRGWLVLAGASLLPLLALIGLVTLFGVLGGGQAMSWALLLLVGPVGSLVLSVRRPIREWTRRGRATPAAGPGGRGARAR